MPKWFGGKSDDGVPREWRTALETVLRPLEKSSKQWRADVRDFVLTGSPPLAALSGPGRSLPSFNLWGGYSADKESEAVRRLCAGLAEVPPEVGVRLGEVLVASGSYGYSLGQPAHLQWLEGLLLGFANANAGAHVQTVRLPIDIRVLESLVESTGRPAGELLGAAFRSTGAARYYGHGRYRTILRVLPGYADAVVRHADAIRPALASTKADDRLVALEMLAGLPGEVLGLFADELADYATGTNSKVRRAAQVLLDDCARAVEPLQQIALTGKPSSRLEALELLHSGDDPEVQAWALATAEQDRAATVRELAERWTRSGSETSDEAGAALPAVEIPEIEWRTHVTQELADQLDRLFAEVDRAIDEANRQQRLHAERWRQAHGTSLHHRDMPRLDRDFLQRLLAALENGTPTEASVGSAVHILQAALARALPGLGLGPAGLTVLLTHCGVLRLGHWNQLWGPAVDAYDGLFRRTGRPTLLEISTMLDQVGYDGGTVVLRTYLTAFGPRLGRDWPDEAVAPFMTVHLDKVLGLLGPGVDHEWSINTMGVFPALATLPVLPPPVTEQLLAAALGPRKAERLPAQDALAKVPGIEERVAGALSDGKAEVRALAAQWLGRRRHESAVPALEQAVAKERQDVALGAMLDALQALGQPVEKYLDRGALPGQAAKALAKGLPKDLDWFPWAGLPPVRWVDGEPVPLEVLQWFLVQAVKGKSAEPNAVLRKYAAMFDPRDREQLGQFVLEAWVAQDLAPIAHGEAVQLAEQHAASLYQVIQRWPQYYQDNPMRNATQEQIVASVLPGFLKQPAGSAASSKGLLAVAAACAGERAAPVAQRYLKEWYGMRAAQGRALIVMLAWIEHPSATQLMLSVGSRFRTKSFQEEATRQAELLAERKGWTVGELADRTIPTAGFDESGVLELSYGDRVFTAHLMPDLSVELRSPDGKPVKALPTPRQTDDESAAKEAKKSLAAAKKELRAVATLQAERLYEALCTERGWTFDDWDRYLRRHPVMRHLTQRLAWTATSDGTVVVFRPLDDGTLTDVDDEEVTPAPDAQVHVAHDSNLEPEDVARWQAHFADYEVTPLFQQLGKGGYELPEELAAKEAIDEFQGHLLEAFALRGRAAKLGYTRGQAQDAGWFYTYDKRFPTLGITAQVTFSGNGLPEENRTVALKSLSFVRNVPDGGGHALRLSEVPSILLSEARNDLRLMAADGTGFDAEWEKKVEY